MIIQKSSNVFTVELTKVEGESKYQDTFLFMSDVHWDNPDCNWDLLRKHLNLAKENGWKVLVNGDFFCLMQGKGDPRRNKDKIRPEHNNARYLDSIVETAVEWFEPWKDVIVWIGLGNHETGIIKHQETDILRRFVDLFNMTHKPTIPISMGAYTSWLLFGSEKNRFVVNTYHGSGGGGPVTKGMIQHQRKMADVDGADAVWMGHVHELYTVVMSKSYINMMTHEAGIKDVWHFRTGTYKDEYKDGAGGWHVERGAPPKPLGCVKVSLTTLRTVGGSRQWYTEVDASILT